MLRKMSGEDVFRNGTGKLLIKSSKHFWSLETKNLLDSFRFKKCPDLRMWGTIIEISQKTFLVAPFCREFSTEFLKA